MLVTVVLSFLFLFQAPYAEAKALPKGLAAFLERMGIPMEDFLRSHQAYRAQRARKYQASSEDFRTRLQDSRVSTECQTKILDPRSPVTYHSIQGELLLTKLTTSRTSQGTPIAHQDQQPSNYPRYLEFQISRASSSFIVVPEVARCRTNNTALSRNRTLLMSKS
ncbi:uncharacterized protein LOC144662218 isoform X3 [Oculina patagonica]